MKNINQLQITLISIFPIDQISIPSLFRRESLNLLNHLFRLQYVQQADPFFVNQNQILLRNGEFVHEDTPYLINEVIIDNRKIIIKMNAPSIIGDAFFDLLKKELVSLDVRRNKIDLTPLITTYETTCVCTLDFDLHSYFGGHDFNEFIDTIEKQIPKHGSTTSITPSSLRFKIDYSNIPEEIRKNKITLAEKYIIIEYREKTNPENRIYLTSSPTRSETHFEILEVFEDYINH